MLGAAEAANIFDYRMGHQFTTLAWWYIKKAMSREEQNTRNTVRLSVYVIDILSEVNHARRVLGHDADLEEIVKLVNARRQERYQAKLREGKTPEPPTEVHTDIIRSAKAALNIDSLERPVGEEGTETLGDFVEDNDMDTEEKTILTARRHAARQAVSIENASQTKNVEELTARQIEILNLRFGLEDGIEHTLEEVAQILYDRDRAAGKPVEKPSSRQAIDKAEKAALAKLRKKLQEWAN
jgi:RNA polymerase primary sigma factor